MTIQATLDTIKQVQPALNYLENYAKESAEELGDEVLEKTHLFLSIISAHVTNIKFDLEIFDGSWAELHEEMSKHPENEAEHALVRVFHHANAATYAVSLIKLFDHIRNVGRMLLSEDNEWTGTHCNTVNDGLDFLHALAEQEEERLTATKKMAAMVEGMSESDLQEASSGNLDRFIAMLEKRAEL